ncbi:RNA polymerase sigma factor [Cryptosporangium phraense]|uniref:RNA polymerase sigma factor n=1 Tax=Cryptosporangium phraense TaxID=2593070 RepID=A0A545ANZ7_9ACTN|nr:RNA polymerase sigma factor [Cryptosporangium phraense]TQS43062.1 RNA polymerase sigma factor [Cryptosporangium phraense]
MTTSDRQLWEATAAGDDDAFGVLFDRHLKAVDNHCFRLTGNWALADDATAATFFAAWRQRSAVTLVHDSALPWLLTVATNTVRNEYRSRRRRAALLERLPVPRPAPDHADDVAQRLDDERRMAEVLAATEELPRAEREALALCVWSGVSYADAAQVLGIAEASVRSRVSRAKSRLSRLVLANAGGEDR